MKKLLCSTCCMFEKKVHQSLGSCCMFFHKIYMFFFGHSILDSQVCIYDVQLLINFIQKMSLLSVSLKRNFWLEYCSCMFKKKKKSENVDSGTIQLNFVSIFRWKDWDKQTYKIFFYQFIKQGHSRPKKVEVYYTAIQNFAWLWKTWCTCQICWSTLVCFLCYLSFPVNSWGYFIFHIQYFIL